MCHFRLGLRDVNSHSPPRDECHSKREVAPSLWVALSGHVGQSLLAVVHAGASRRFDGWHSAGLLMLVSRT